MTHPLDCSRMLLINRTKLARTTSELGLELFNAACSVDETLLTGKYRVRIGRDVLHEHVVFDSINRLLTLGLHGRLRKKLFTRRYVLETGWIELWMTFFFHVTKMVSGSTLACFITRVSLVDNVHPSLTTNYLAVRMAVFKRLN